MVDVASLVLPAAFGTLGILLGGFLTIWGQRQADNRAHEKFCEDHYAALANELIFYLRDRTKLLTTGLALQGTATRKLVDEAQEKFPLTYIVLRIETSFPEMRQFVEQFADQDVEIVDFIYEISRDDGKGSRFTPKLRQERLEKLLDAQQPILAALVTVRAQLTLKRPKRLDIRKVMEVAHSELPTAGSSEPAIGNDQR